jgi:hypothetical protein
MALQPRYAQGLSEKIPPLYSISSEIRPVMGPKVPDIAVHANHPPTWILVFLGFLSLQAWPYTGLSMGDLRHAENLPLTDEQSIFFPLGQHPRFAAVQQDQANLCMITLLLVLFSSL